jgi:hypothetical protein
MSKLPPCASWKIWKGNEVEGTKEIGEPTLFIRSLEGFVATEDSDFSFLAEKSKCRRVWFCSDFICKDFDKWKIVSSIAKHFLSICLEVEPKNLESVPLEFRKKFTIYLKVNAILKKGDVVCVGQPFNDESWEVGTGKKVNPKDYERDTRIV